VASEHEIRVLDGTSEVAGHSRSYDRGRSAAGIAFARPATLVICTLPPGISRWLKLDLVHRAERKSDCASSTSWRKPPNRRVGSLS
jgi:hypothetical protein